MNRALDVVNKMLESDPDDVSPEHYIGAANPLQSVVTQQSDLAGWKLIKDVKGHEYANNHLIGWLRKPDPTGRHGHVTKFMVSIWPKMNTYHYFDTEAECVHWAALNRERPRYFENVDPDDVNPQHYIDQAAKEMNAKVDSFTQGYIEAALWSSVGDDDTPLDQVENDLSLRAKLKMMRDCRRFQSENAELLAQAGEEAQNGHDFWLTRNHHGVGFWDRDYDEAVGDALTEICHKWGEVNLYIGDDGEIHSDDEHVYEAFQQENKDPDDVSPEHYVAQLTPYYCQKCNAILTKPESINRSFVSPVTKQFFYSVKGHYSGDFDFTPDETYSPDYPNIHNCDAADYCATCGSGSIEMFAESHDDIDDPETIMRSDWRYSLEKVGFKLTSSDTCEKKWRVPRSEYIVLYVKPIAERPGWLQFRAGWGEAGGTRMHQWVARFHERFINVIIPKFEAWVNSSLDKAQSLKSKPHDISLGLIDRLTMWADQIMMQGLGEAVEHQLALTLAQEKFVTEIVEAAAPDPIDYEQYIAQLKVSPTDHIPCGKNCACGQPCTFMHRRADTFEHEHICQACDVANFNAILDRI